MARLMGLEPTTFGETVRRSSQLSYSPMAPWVGLEPTTNRLTADGSTIELPRNNIKLNIHTQNSLNRGYNKNSEKSCSTFEL